MAKMKKKQQNEKLYCPYCGGLAVLRPAEYVYGERNLNPDNYLYVCSGYPSCDSYIGVHKKSMRPMGTLANGDLRHKRIEAHRALNFLLLLTDYKKDMHIGMFSEYRCEETIRECNTLMEQYAKTNRSSSCEKKIMAA